MGEGSDHFERGSSVFIALNKIAKRLDELKIPYVVAGGLALFEHGFRRFTDDVDLLVTAESLELIHRELEGLGYVPPFKNSKHLRDAEFGVRVEFLVTGQFPGDGKPKPVAFPNPADVTHESAGIKYVSLEKLVELKLASGISNSLRGKDLADVQELIQAIGLQRSFSQKLNEYVRPKYLEIWDLIRSHSARFVKEWSDKTPLDACNSIHDLILANPTHAALLSSMQQDGITLEHHATPNGDTLRLVTTDPDIAKKYDMHDEADFL